VPSATAEGEAAAVPGSAGADEVRYEVERRRMVGEELRGSSAGPARRCASTRGPAADNELGVPEPVDDEGSGSRRRAEGDEEGGKAPLTVVRSARTPESPLWTLVGVVRELSGLVAVAPGGFAERGEWPLGEKEDESERRLRWRPPPGVTRGPEGVEGALSTMALGPGERRAAGLERPGEAMRAVDEGAVAEGWPSVGAGCWCVLYCAVAALAGRSSCAG